MYIKYIIEKLTINLVEIRQIATTIVSTSSFEYCNREGINLTIVLKHEHAAKATFMSSDNNDINKTEKASPNNFETSSLINSFTIHIVRALEKIIRI